MCDFKPGDEVVCVDDSPSHRGACPARRGAIYTISHIDNWPSVDGSPSVYLVRLPGNTGNGGFRASRFRKVERRTDKLSLTEWLSQPAGDTDGIDRSAPIAPRKRERA